VALHFVNTANVTDAGSLELDGALGATTAVVAGTTYLFVTGNADAGVSVFAVAADGTLTNVDNVDDSEAAALQLNFARGVTAASVGGTTYLFVRGFFGVSVFSVGADGTLTNVDNVADDATLNLDGDGDVVTAVIGGTTYLFATAYHTDGLTAFSVAADGTLTHVDDLGSINSPRGVATAVIGGVTYLFVTSDPPYERIDRVAIVAVGADGTLTWTGAILDNTYPLLLHGAYDVDTAVVGGRTYLYATGFDDDGVSAFSLDDWITNVGNSGGLHGAAGLTAAVVDGVTVLFVTASISDAFSAYAVAADGSLANVHNVGDAGPLELNGASDVTTAVIAGTTYVFVTGQVDDGVSVFRVAETVPSLGDVLWQHWDGTVATAGQEFPAVPDTWQITGIGDFDGDGDSDILWHHDEGTVVTWEMEGGTLQDTYNFGVVTNSFQTAGTGDFDGDGDDDFLWRHDEGQVVTWELENGAFVVNHNLAVAGSSWQISGTGDFDGDGDADILWRHDDGQVVSWEMEDGAFVVNHNLAVAGASWQISGTGDFDGDGDADILWRHDEGAVVTWEMEDGTFVTNHNLPVVAEAGWHIAGTEDFDSDGDADILWRQDQGLVVTWEMEDGHYVVNHNFGVVTDAWQIRGTGEFDLV
jgi:6-phosphogluconolactonase (cycloisomerase 2 family)